MRTLDGVPLDGADLRWAIPTPGQPPTSVARPFLEFFAGSPLPEWDSFSRTIKIIRLRPQEILYDVGEDHPDWVAPRRDLARRQTATGRSRRRLGERSSRHQRR